MYWSSSYAKEQRPLFRLYIMRTLSFFSLHLFVFCFMFVCVLTSVESRRQNIVFNPKLYVEVYNKFSSGSFNIHCKSKQDDLGFHDIWSAQFYQFHFRMDVSARTLFFCTIQSQYGHATFDVYYAQRDIDRCKRCLWDVTQDGIYGFKEKGHVQDITINWTK